jgi:hypothetical protein
MPMAETASFVVSRADVTLLLAELRDHPSDPVYAPLLEALLAAAQTLEAGAPSQGASDPTTRLGLPAEHVQPFRMWLARAALRASRVGQHGEAAAFKRVWESTL